jgi:hypothetical protein
MTSTVIWLRRVDRSLNTLDFKFMLSCVPHNTKKMFSCFFCSHSFLSLESLISHIKLKHKALMNYEVQCNITDCFYKFACVHSLIKHIKNEHAVQKLSCEITEVPNNLNKDVVDLIKETNPIQQHITILTEPLKDLPETLCNNEEFTIDQFKRKVFNFALCLVTQLYAYGSLNRKLVHKIIIDICTTYINNCLDFFKCKFQNIVLHDMLDVMKNGFNTFRTEHLTLTFLSKINCFFPPKKVVIKSFLKYGKLKSRRCFIIRKRTLSIIPIKLVLKKFLEMPMVFSAIMK